LVTSYDVYDVPPGNGLEPFLQPSDNHALILLTVFISQTTNECLHVARLTRTPMATVRAQPTAVYHRNDSLNIALSVILHMQTNRKHFRRKQEAHKHTHGLDAWSWSHRVTGTTSSLMPLRTSLTVSLYYNIIGSPGTSLALLWYTHVLVTTGPLVLAVTFSWNLEDFVGAKFYCAHGWWQLAYSDLEEDAWVLLNGVVCTVSVKKKWKRTKICVKS